MPPELLQVIIQLPIVAIFIWYSDRKDKQFQAFLDKQRAEYIAALEKLTGALEEHAEETTKAISMMNERTRPRGGSTQ